MPDNRKQQLLKGVEAALKNGDGIIFTGVPVFDVVSREELRQLAAPYGREAEVIAAASKLCGASNGSR